MSIEELTPPQSSSEQTCYDHQLLVDDNASGLNYDNDIVNNKRSDKKQKKKSTKQKGMHAYLSTHFIICVRTHYFYLMHQTKILSVEPVYASTYIFTFIKLVSCFLCFFLEHILLF